MIETYHLRQEGARPLPTNIHDRPVAIVGAASNIGIRPYDDGTRARGLDRAPAVLRELGLVERLAADDLGDLTPRPYRDFTRPLGGIRNEDGVTEFCRVLADRVAAALDGERFALVLGGDCSIVLGSLLGARRARGRVGLVYVDGHADFGTPAESLTGSAASMCLALAVGRGDSPLARLSHPAPLVAGEDVALVGRRDAGQEYYGHAALGEAGILDLPGPVLARTPADGIADAVLERVTRIGIDGFWIHVDADVLNPEVMPAVDSPEPGGPGIAELAELIAPLARHPRVSPSTPPANSVPRSTSPFQCLRPG
jgi:arginase